MTLRNYFCVGHRRIRETPDEKVARCQFHQHFARKFFVQKSFEQLFSA